MARGSCHATSGLAWTRGPGRHAARLGLMLETVHAPPPPAAFHARLAHLSGPWMTAQWKRPANNGVMTSRPWAKAASIWVWQGRQSTIRRSRSKCEPPWMRCRM
jgi:hypothetical protein